MLTGPLSPQQTLATLPVRYNVSAKTITKHVVTKRKKMSFTPRKTLRDENSLIGRNETTMREKHRNTHNRSLDDTLSSQSNRWTHTQTCKLTVIEPGRHRRDLAKRAAYER